MEEISLILKKMLIDSVERNRADGILLSGGLDSAILASIDPKLKAFTISLERYGEDIEFSKNVVNLLGMEQLHLNIGIDQAIETVPKIIKILKSFDPAIPNDLPVYFGLMEAKKKGISTVMTGDGSDELLAGYSFMQDIPDLKKYIERISRRMFFNSNMIGDFLGVDIKQPYIGKELLDFALSIDKQWKIREENGRIFGKWILRKAFENNLPDHFIWQDKRPLEVGSGMSKLREIISDKVSDEEYKENDSNIKFYNKEHFYYYRIYRDLFGEIPKPKQGENECPGCKTGLPDGAFHCRLCGWVRDIDEE